MNNIDRVILMTKFAIYDKNTGKSDRKTNDYFLNDYVYHKNCWTRLCVFLGSLIVIFIYWLHKIVIEHQDIFLIDYKSALINGIVFIIAVMAIYTVIGTYQAARDYERAQRRLRRYFKLMKNLDHSTHEAYAEEASDDGAGFVS